MRGQIRPVLPRFLFGYRQAPPRGGEPVMTELPRAGLLRMLVPEKLKREDH